jgi:hypothetical protein
VIGRTFAPTPCQCQRQAETGALPPLHGRQPAGTTAGWGELWTMLDFPREGDV